MFPDTEIWVTEFNSNLSSRNSLNDSEYQAAYLAKEDPSSADALRISAMGYYLYRTHLFVIPTQSFSLRRLGTVLRFRASESLPTS